eukprot:15406997-Heterocapsa_arctica.AAC.1
MTKKETEEMVSGRYRIQNFWIFTTSYEEQEERGGTIQKLGFKYYRDWGNGTYSDLLKSMTIKAKADGIINAEDFASIMKYGPNNLGNIVETIL